MLDLFVYVYFLVVVFWTADILLICSFYLVFCLFCWKLFETLEERERILCDTMCYQKYNTIRVCECALMQNVDMYHINIPCYTLDNYFFLSSWIESWDELPSKQNKTRKKSAQLPYCTRPVLTQNCSRIHAALECQPLSFLATWSW